MTTVTVLRDSRGVCGLQAAGHADYADEGYDIVCAAVSVLMTTCANALESVAGVTPAVSQDDRSATLAISLPQDFEDARRRDAAIVLQTALLGLTDVAAQYPKHLHIIDGRNHSC